MDLNHFAYLCTLELLAVVFPGLYIWLMLG
jgi:hypothetical protein